MGYWSFLWYLRGCYEIILTYCHSHEHYTCVMVDMAFKLTLYLMFGLGSVVLPQVFLNSDQRVYK